MFEFGKHVYTEISQHDTGNFLKFVHHVVMNKIVKAVEENPNHGGRKMAFIVDLDGFSLRNISSAHGKKTVFKVRPVIWHMVVQTGLQANRINSLYLQL